MCHAVLAAVSGCCSPRIGRLLTRYSPVRHSVISLPPRRTSQKCFVRLECVKHAASVHPEPGSNSLKNLYIPGQSLLCPLIPSSELILASFPKSTVQSFSTRSFFVLSLLFNFQGPSAALFVPLPEAARLFYHILSPFVKRIFKKFFIFSHLSDILHRILQFFFSISKKSRLKTALFHNFQASFPISPAFFKENFVKTGPTIS